MAPCLLFLMGFFIGRLDEGLSEVGNASETGGLAEVEVGLEFGSVVLVVFLQGG